MRLPAPSSADPASPHRHAAGRAAAAVLASKRPATALSTVGDHEAVIAAIARRSRENSIGPHNFLAHDPSLLFRWSSGDAAEAQRRAALAASGLDLLFEDSADVVLQRAQWMRLADDGPSTPRSNAAARGSDRSGTTIGATATVASHPSPSPPVVGGGFRPSTYTSPRAAFTRTQARVPPLDALSPALPGSTGPSPQGGGAAAAAAIRNTAAAARRVLSSEASAEAQVSFESPTLSALRAVGGAPVCASDLPTAGTCPASDSDSAAGPSASRPTHASRLRPSSRPGTGRSSGRDEGVSVGLDGLDDGDGADGPLGVSVVVCAATPSKLSVGMLEARSGRLDALGGVSAGRRGAAAGDDDDEDEDGVDDNEDSDKTADRNVRRFSVRSPGVQGGGVAGVRALVESTREAHDTAGRAADSDDEPAVTSPGAMRLIRTTAPLGRPTTACPRTDQFLSELIGDAVSKGGVAHAASTMLRPSTARGVVAASGETETPASAAAADGGDRWAGVPDSADAAVWQKGRVATARHTRQLLAGGLFGIRLGAESSDDDGEGADADAEAQGGGDDADSGYGSDEIRPEDIPVDDEDEDRDGPTGAAAGALAASPDGEGATAAGGRFSRAASAGPIGALPGSVEDEIARADAMMRVLMRGKGKGGDDDDDDDNDVNDDDDSDG